MDTATVYILLAAAFGLFMAWGIGANDVANAMATSVGHVGARAHALALQHLGMPDDLRRPGILARAWPIGVTALWIAVLLTTYVFFYYI